MAVHVAVAKRPAPKYTTSSSAGPNPREQSRKKPPVVPKSLQRAMRTHVREGRPLDDGGDGGMPAVAVQQHAGGALPAVDASTGATARTLAALATATSGPINQKRAPRARRVWTKDEDDKMLEAAKRLGCRNWKEIATFVPGRSAVQCLQRWRNAINPNLKKGHWSQVEDNALRALVLKSPRNWGQVAKGMPRRTAKQCRERFTNHLDPTIVRGGWTPEDDAILMKMLNEIGNKWATIARAIPGRTENSVKIRAKSIKRKSDRAQKKDACGPPAPKKAKPSKSGKAREPGKLVPPCEDKAVQSDPVHSYSLPLSL